MGDMVLKDSHLAAADAGAYIRHTVVVANLLVLVIRVTLAVLGRVHHNLTPGLLVGRDERAAAGSRNHLVAVEGKDSVFAECAQDLTVEAGAEAFGGILDDRNSVSVSYFHDAVYPVRHAVERHRDYRLRGAARLGDPVLDRLLQEIRIHIPSVRFTVHEYRSGAKVGDRMGGGAESEALHQHLVARPYAAPDKPQVHRRSPRAQRHDAFAEASRSGSVHELLQVLLEPVHVRPKRHHPIGVERLLDKLLLAPAHMREAKIDAVSHRNM